jgi:hypothetical protein
MNIHFKVKKSSWFRRLCITRKCLDHDSNQSHMYKKVCYRKFENFNMLKCYTTHPLGTFWYYKYRNHSFFFASTHLFISHTHIGQKDLYIFHWRLAGSEQVIFQEPAWRLDSFAKKSHNTDSKTWPLNRKMTKEMSTSFWILRFTSNTCPENQSWLGGCE